jgi:phosphoribosylanthranilate isomerase
MKVKICGITNKQDASAAVALGVDALGFIFAKSRRLIEPEKARAIIESLPPFVLSVGVFVNEAPTRIMEIAGFCGLDMIQFHGDESPDVCSAFMPRAIKAFQLKDESSLEQIKPYRGKVRAFLFDTYSKEKRGGTGKTFDWSLAVNGSLQGMPIILSGGLSPSNIEYAVLTVKPYAVDLNSGVEKSPGRKDHNLMKQLMKVITQISNAGGPTVD